MKIYAICVVKNEVDIIEYSIRCATDWADKVIILDNGSTDGTWEKVMAIKHPKVIPYKQITAPYSDGLRAKVFDAFKNELQHGDWWVIQDADEIFDQSPREFIQNQSGYFHHINGKKVDFCFDLTQLETIIFSNNFETDAHLFDYYSPIAWSEPRAIKHRSKLEWTKESIWPKHMGLVCDNAINIRHYPLRSREQIRKRWETRKNTSVGGGQYFNHWEKQDLKEYYSAKAVEQKRIESGENVFHHVKFANEYRQGFVKRFVKTILHRSGILKTVTL
jgi:glycosyltransferase involved in cell wall biosynthesis